MSPFWIIVLIFAAIAIISAIYSSARERQRTSSWEELASQPGMEFLGESNDVLTRGGNLKTFQVGRSRRVRNVISVDSAELRILAGDFRYRTGSGKNSHTHHRTFCMLESSTLNVPRCYLRPESRLFDALGSMMGGQDFDFAEDPEFSKAYVLQGESERAVRELFDAEVRRWFCERVARRFQFEAEGNVLVFHTGNRRPPNEVSGMMDEALQIVRLLSRLNGESPSERPA